MKRIYSLFAALTCLLTSSWAQSEVMFELAQGIQDGQLKQKIEVQVSRLLTEINNAAAENRSLNLQKIEITQEARQRLVNRWERSSHFRCEDSEIVEKCLQDVNGYEIRNIGIQQLNEEGKRQELCINLSPKGSITDVHPVWDTRLWEKEVMRNSKDVVDARRRTELLSFVERFRSFYDEKDIDALDKIFSDDALIITGSVIKRKQVKNDSPSLRSEVVYRRQTKQQYLKNLTMTFKKNDFIKLTFDDIQMGRHGATGKENIYWVALHQHWASSSYEDDGYVFLVWEFPKNDEPPVIHVRTWQPDRIDGQVVSEEDRLNINDFFFP